MDKNSNTWKEIMSLVKNSPTTKDEGAMLRSLGLDDDMLKKIKVNTLITTGTHDTGSTPKMSENLSKMIQGSKFVEIKEGKHLCGIECANDVNIVFKEFIDTNNG